MRTVLDLWTDPFAHGQLYVQGEDAKGYTVFVCRDERRARLHKYRVSSLATVNTICRRREDRRRVLVML